MSHGQKNNLTETETQNANFGNSGKLDSDDGYQIRRLPRRYRILLIRSHCKYHQNGIKSYECIIQSTRSRKSSKNLNFKIFSNKKAFQ